MIDRNKYLKETFGSKDESLGSDINTSSSETTTLIEDNHVGIQYLGSLREKIEIALDSFTKLSNDSPMRLTSALRYSLLAPGKRLRPSLTLLAADLCGGKIEDAIPAGVALECVHAYSLIHDDLPVMDDSDLRRGRLTCHKQYDDATAILAGDALLTLAFEILVDNIPDPVTASRCVLSLAKAAGPCGMVGGQADDVAWGAVMKEAPMARDLFEELTSSDFGNFETVREPSEELVKFLFKVHRRKTGALINAALELGAIVAKASEAQLNSLRLFGTALGQAFQIADDILDAVGDEETMGKRLRRDEEAGKLTYVSLFGLNKSREWLTRMVNEAKESLTSSRDLWDRDSQAFNAALYLADYTARRNK